MVNKSKNILKRLESLHPKQIDLSLGRILRLLKKLKNPHLNLPPTIHVAGTNGKGSTIAFLRSIFEKNKFKVHVYTSPHLVNFNERIRISSNLINNEYLNSLLEECEYYNKKCEITFFEITTAAAYLAFSRNKADILLLETGLGGKFDATNIISSTFFNLITPISMDHMIFLGNTINKITKEKVGIFKNNVPAVISPQNTEAMSVITKEAKLKNVKLYRYKKEWNILRTTTKSFKLKILENELLIPIPKMLGKHQIFNAASAVTLVKKQKRFKLKDGLIKEGIVETFWPARMQKLDKGKISKFLGEKFEIWLDGGHNIDASKKIKKILDKWKSNNVILIVGMVNGKDPKSFLENLIGLAKITFAIPIKNCCCIEPRKISELFNNKIKEGKSIDDVIKEIKLNFKEGKILICGSLYLAGEVLDQENYIIN
ncbi:MAG: bifunctional folylpolyglutamate synthase/ dihydrofolate synthase [Rickettsiales bacterium]|nr:bifunctional folylpolyglutamate synthase/ dihydrofolate synthase [Rickettsiales bacterium]OUV54094.1 MAG: hypothetical protein CBC87_02100 [Rickettsiales bacterium TMED127]